MSARIRTRHAEDIVLVPVLKAFHIVFVVTWFAGLFYLPRLFIYHATATDTISLERFVVMERRLFAIMTIGGVLAAAFGVALLAIGVAAAPQGHLGYLEFGWMQAKLALVGLLIGYHCACSRLMAEFRLHRNRWSQRSLRWFNEAPGLLLIAIVLLAVVKPF